MSAPITPEPIVTAMRLFVGGSNIKEFIEFCGGTIERDEDGSYEYARLADERTYIHQGDYALRLADGSIKKMYDYDYHDLFAPIEESASKS